VRGSGGDQAGTLIEAFTPQPHPEGRRYRETWRAAVESGERGGGTAIYFLLESHQRSHWRRVDADEHWFWHGAVGRVGRLTCGKDHTGPARLASGRPGGDAAQVKNLPSMDMLKPIDGARRGR
jgi:predicted cupin superfamily sugar epimerase